MAAPAVTRPAVKPGTVVSGLRGRVQWHYHIAADVGGFTVDRDEDGRLWLRAAVGPFNEYRLSQTPLTFLVTVTGGEWHFPVRRVVSFADHRFVAELAAPRAQPGRS